MRIRIDNLNKAYGRGEARTPVLRDVNLTIEPGEFVAIIGTSGSGKTTLLNIIGGLDRGFTGEVHVGDDALANLSEKQLARLRNRRFGFVFQQFNLLDHLTGEENVALPGFFAAASSQDDATEDPARAAHLLERVGLSDKRDARPPQLSGGQKQRVAIARALFNGPDLLLCDEPTGSLDRTTGLQIMDLFGQLNAEDGLTLIVVTHEEYIARMARRIIRLEDGVVVADQAQTPRRPDVAEIDLVRGTNTPERPNGEAPTQEAM